MKKEIARILLAEGYIKGYQENSKVDYYVFATDESGRRMQQPIFGKDDPHTFTMGAYGEKMTLTLNPEEIVFDYYYSYDIPEILTITNNTASDVVIESIKIKDNDSYEIEYDFTLPYTIAVDESVEVDVYLRMIICKSPMLETEIVITSSVGEQIVPVMYDGEVDLEEINFASTEVYPNPMNDVLYIDGDDAEYLKGKRVLIVDDVISTGESLNALEQLVEKAGGIVYKKAFVLAEGDAKNRKDIQYLATIPLL